KLKVRKSSHQARDVSAWGLHFDRHRNRVSVVFHHENQWQPLVGRGVQRLPKLSFAGSSVAEGNIGDLVAMEHNVFILTVIARGLLGGFGMSGKITAGLGASYGLQNLRPRGW